MRLLLCVLLLAGGALAQRTDTIYAQLSVPGGGVGNTGEPANIGQSYHDVTALFANNGGNTCADPADLLSLQVSYDGTTWWQPQQNQPNRFSAVGGTIVRNIKATGSFPHLRVTVLSYDTTNCTLTLWYTGNLQPLQSVYPIGTINPGGTTNALRAATFSVSAATTTTIVAAGGSSAAIAIYGVYLYNAAAQTLTIQSSGGTAYYSLPSFPASGQLSIPNAGVGQFLLGRNQGLQLITSAASAVSGYILYRYE